MKILSRSLAILLLAGMVIAVGTSCNAWKNAKGSVGGTVYVNHRPEGFATVQLYQGDTYVKQERCSDTGHYMIRDIDPGDYTLVVLNARGVIYPGETLVQIGRKFEQVDIEIDIQAGGL